MLVCSRVTVGHRWQARAGQQWRCCGLGEERKTTRERMEPWYYFWRTSAAPLGRARTREPTYCWPVLPPSGPGNEGRAPKAVPLPLFFQPSHVMLVLVPLGAGGGGPPGRGAGGRGPAGEARPS